MHNSRLFAAHGLEIEYAFHLDDKAFRPQLHVTLSNIQWHSQYFTLLKPSKTDQQGRSTMINFCKLTKLTCPYHSMATYIALAAPKDP